MLRFELELKLRNRVSVTIDVDAERTDDAFVLARAWMVTHGMKGGVVKARLSADNHKPLEQVCPPFSKVPKVVDRGYNLKEADYSALEMRILSMPGDQRDALDWLRTFAPGTDIHAARAEREGITREQAKVLNFKDLYSPCPQRMFFVSGHADALPKEDSSNRRYYPVECAYEVPPERAPFSSGRGYINLYPKSDGNVQAGNVYTSREDAQRAAKYPESVTVACITWETQRPVQPQYGPPSQFFQLTAGQVSHLSNRLRAWTNMPDKGAKVSVYKASRTGCVNITVGSPQWQKCLDALRAWFDKNGVQHWHRSGTTTVVEARWADIAPLFWPL